MFHTKALYLDHRTLPRNADRFHLLVTGGSDCHGMSKGKPLIGTVKVPYQHVKHLKRKRRSVVRRRWQSGEARSPLSFFLSMGLFAKFKVGLQKTHSKLNARD